MAVNALFAAGTLQPISPIGEIPGIGPYLGGRLRGRNIYNILDLVRYFDQQSLQATRNRLYRLMQNARGNMCVGNNVDYHVRDINKRGYNSLAEVLRYASANPAPFAAVGYNIVGLNPPPASLDRDQAAATCSCFATPETCSGAQRTYETCRWIPAAPNLGDVGVLPAAGQCVPRRNRGPVGFPGKPGYSDQVVGAGQAARGLGVVYGPVADNNFHGYSRWRRPGALPFVNLPVPNH